MRTSADDSNTTSPSHGNGQSNGHDRDRKLQGPPPGKHSTKLSREQRSAEIRLAYRNKEPVETIAKRFGLSPAGVYYHVNKRKPAKKGKHRIAPKGSAAPRTRKALTVQSVRTPAGGGITLTSLGIYAMAKKLINRAEARGRETTGFEYLLLAAGRFAIEGEDGLAEAPD